MNAIVQYVVNSSTLEVSWIKITNATQDSFIMSIDSRVTGTGPMSSTMSAMELDMSGPGGAFGRLRLPEIKTKSTGTQVEVRDQMIKITNMEAFKAFVKALIQDESLILRLENGHATIKALFANAKIIYAKDIHLKGMNGPKTIMVKTEGHGKNFTNVMRSTNPSPVEMDLGTLNESIVNANGKKIAEQTGTVYLMRGETDFVMAGSVTGVAAEGDARIVGLSVEEDNWNNLTIPYLNTATTVTEKFIAFCKTNA
ncbi:hypothetical protein D0Z07_8119 [Hyphodiscus hymeniophilus]|uniref:Uncharacterized protein n=1 Tax=Hyphodiscus hymeniophilus TaxID=353542 RepID=A0A9P6VEG4_9HELO|nr:hypothetical protein D0Z07_8119 [Hyphodiscus hymeniophilus]